MVLEEDIKEIKEQMKEHNTADDRRFDAVLVKLELNHDVHIRNEELLKRIELENHAQSARLEKVSSEYAKTVGELAKITSHNSGQIIALWEVNKKEKRAMAFIDNTLSAGVFVKWLFYVTVGISALIGAIKVIFGGWFYKLLNL